MDGVPEAPHKELHHPHLHDTTIHSTSTARSRRTYIHTREMVGKTAHVILFLVAIYTHMGAIFVDRKQTAALFLQARYRRLHVRWASKLLEALSARGLAAGDADVSLTCALCGYDWRSAQPR